MDDISKILDAIEAEGKEEAERIIEKNRANIEELNRLYDREANIAGQDIFSQAEKDAHRIYKKNLSQADIKSRNIRLTARRNILEQAFAEAEKTLEKAPKNRKKDFYEKLIAKYGVGETAVVQLNAADKKLLGNKLKAEGVKIKIDDQAGDFSGGLIIKEGNIETDCTFETMIEQVKTEHEWKIADILFSKEHGGEL